MIFPFLQNILTKRNRQLNHKQTLSMEEQIKMWHKADRKMSWEINNNEFEHLESPPVLTDDDRQDGYIGVALFYGFGDDGSGHANAVLSGKLAWEYACKRRKGKTWQCEYVDFNKIEDIRLRPDAPQRPKGFYYTKIQPGEQFQKMTISQVRKNFQFDTGCGPEGFQFLIVTHPHFADLMAKKKMPFMALADYDVAPYGYNDFYNAPQLFCSNNIIGLGIGNVDRNYPLFGIPTLRMCL